MRRFGGSCGPRKVHILINKTAVLPNLKAQSARVESAPFRGNFNPTQKLAKHSVWSTESRTGSTSFYTLHQTIVMVLCICEFMCSIEKEAR